jgi:hypothetical protein
MDIKGCKRKSPITYRPIKIVADFSTETLKARRSLSEIYRGFKGNNFSLWILYPLKLSLKI